MRCKTVLIALTLLMAGVPPVAAQGSGRSLEKKAIIRSLVLPGWGQHLLGERTAARRFLLAEAGLWLGYAWSHSSAGWYQQEYRAFAALRAGASPDRQSDLYYVRLGRYDSIISYNQEQLRQRNLGDVYDLGMGLDWEWDRPASREFYTDLRRTSLLAGKTASFIVGGMVVNRAVSVIHVLFLSRMERTPTVSWVPLPGGGVMNLSLTLSEWPRRGSLREIPPG